MEDILQLPNWSDKTILIAEDLDDNYAVLAALLKNTHAHLLRAINGQEVLDMVAETSKIDLILMDISIPDIDGIEATRIIKQQFPDQIIIAQTAHDISNQMEHIDQEGFDAILLKPIRRNILVSTLNKYLS